ncbi:SEP-domain-containing protein [Auriscalpium vulgare]|uniref:SEP-domain-containing protein n=1 Tax=Auriscalpium vulgare TaxID=40419 RepID=A0ACB8S9M6_9AGAM|nr:SEP-domain-containing protein [Auriscalpium vulgare]
MGRPRPSGDDDDDDDEDDGPPQNFFAGGERSGLSVQNPDSNRNTPGGSVVRDLLRRAAEAGPPPQDEGGQGVFSGGGYTLGSDDIESSFIPDPNAPPAAELETAIRHVTFWRDGFSIEDGDLRRYDDPEQARILNEISSGNAPPSIMNVLPNQPVELRVARRTDEDYVPSTGTRAAFHGSGNRLGAPAGASASASTGAGALSGMPGAFPGSAPPPSAPPVERESLTTRFEVDQTKPMTSVQVRLADGTRIVARMNLTHTVRDLRNFINAASRENAVRAYTIGTTFPNRTLEDQDATIEGAGLVNSVIVQRWA